MTVQLSTRIPRSLWKEVRLDAAQQGITLSEWVSNALEAHLKEGKDADHSRGNMGAGSNGSGTVE